jgi:starvation-inducible DNA-binding protein
MVFHTGMNEQERASVSGALAKVLADTYLLYLKTQNFHWNYTGVEFYPFHLLFEKQYEELAETIDEVAERIRALGFFVEGTMDSFKKISSIREEHRIIPGHEMVTQLIEGHETVIRELRTLSTLAEKYQDAATVDLVGRRLGMHEKFAWMLRSSAT